MEYQGNFQIHAKGKIGEKEIDFAIDMKIDPDHLAQANEFYIEPALVQLAQELEFRLTGTSSDWSMNIAPLDAPDAA